MKSPLATAFCFRPLSTGRGKKASHLSPVACGDIQWADLKKIHVHVGGKFGENALPRPPRFSKPRRSLYGQKKWRKQSARPIADRIVHIPCPIRQQVLNLFQADGQGQAGRDDQPERMSGKSEAPERGQGHKHQGVREVIEAEVDYGGVGQDGQLFYPGQGPVRPPLEMLIVSPHSI